MGAAALACVQTKIKKITWQCQFQCHLNEFRFKCKTQVEREITRVKTTNYPGRKCQHKSEWATRL